MSKTKDQVISITNADRQAMHARHLHEERFYGFITSPIREEEVILKDIGDGSNRIYFNKLTE